MRVFLATSNKGKIREFEYLLKNYGIEVRYLEKSVQVFEDGKTYLENAIKKAFFWSKIVQDVIISEDSGIEIDYLGGFPGVNSSKTPNQNATDKDRCIFILYKLKDVPYEKRKARYVSTIVILKNGFWYSADGKVEGYISTEMKGDKGFGYDPIFFSPELGKNFGEAEIEEKNLVSHRARAIKKLEKILLNLKDFL